MQSSILKTWKSIADSVAEKIATGTLTPGQRIPSGDEIAAAWGVSRHTAHRAIEELQRQGLVVRQRRWGTVVATQERKTVGRVALMVDRFAPAVNFPPAEMLRGISDGLGEGTDLVVIDARSDPAVEARRLRDLGDVDGLIVVPTADPANTPLLQRLVDKGFPVVVLDRIPDGLHADGVTSDNESATCAALHALEARGHHRIGFFSFHKPDFSTIRERHKAYVSALEEVGLTDRADHERWFARELESDTQRLFLAISDALFALTHGPNPITALFCVQDMFAAGAIEAMNRHGIDLPLATFNDWPDAMLRTPPGTLRIVQRAHAIGLRAAELLLDTVGGNVREPRLVRVPAQLLIPGFEQITTLASPDRPMEAILQ